MIEITIVNYHLDQNWELKNQSSFRGSTVFSTDEYTFSEEMLQVITKYTTGISSMVCLL